MAAWSPPFVAELDNRFRANIKTQELPFSNSHRARKKLSYLYRRQSFVPGLNLQGLSRHSHSTPVLSADWEQLDAAKLTSATHE